jgi:alcohol dehydrogenase class IV
MPEVWVGSDALDALAATLLQWGCQRPMLVTTQDLVRFGVVDTLLRTLAPEKNQLDVTVFDAVEPDPTLTLVAEAVTRARDAQVDVVLALGGGSAIDTAKMVAALITNTQPLDVYVGSNLLTQPTLPLVAIPTTAGTGSEVTPIAILTDEAAQLKKGVVSNFLVPKLAVLAPQLTFGLPPSVTAATGMDALTHAIESYTSNRHNAFSDPLALRAVTLIAANLRAAYHNGQDTVARENMLLASLLAGIAFTNAGVAAVHAFAYPLGGMFHIPHGVANSLMLVPVLEFNAPAATQRFVDLAKAFLAGANLRALPEDAVSAQTLIEEVDALCRDIGIPPNLAALNVTADSLPRMADDVMTIQRLLLNNPREVRPEDAVALYEAAFRRS